MASRHGRPRENTGVATLGRTSGACATLPVGVGSQPTAGITLSPRRASFLFMSSEPEQTNTAPASLEKRALHEVIHLWIPLAIVLVSVCAAIVGWRASLADE